MTVVLPVPDVAWAWRESAACQGTPLTLWYPANENEPNAEALAMCSWCPARPDCLADITAVERGMSRSFRHGTRAGLTPKQRAELEAGLPLTAVTPAKPAEPGSRPRWAGEPRVCTGCGRTYQARRTQCSSCSSKDYRARRRTRLAAA